MNTDKSKLLGPLPERVAFEAWKQQREGGYYLSRNNTPGSDLGGYQDAHTQGQWEAWQAAVGAGRERCARLCEAPVHTLQLPDSPQHDGDVRNVERRVALALAAAIRA